jgi:guanylate cyclase
MSLSPTVSRFFNRLLSVGADPADPPDLRQRKRLFVGFLWGGLFGYIFFLPFVVALGSLQLAAQLPIAFFVLLGLLISLHLRPALFSICVHVLCSFSILGISSGALLFGGIITGGFVFIPGVLIPMIALILLGPRAGKFWLGAFFTAVIAVALLSDWVPARYVLVLPNPNAAMASQLIALGFFFFLFLMYFIRQRDQFQRKSDDLLRNILPDEIAERLKDSSALIADHFERASVLFADVVAFTPMSAQMSPTELVALLNEVFSEFDQLVERQDLEKIKTIGDCYMVAAGVPLPRADHAQALTQLALEMQALVARRDFQGHPLRFRIGLNSGPLIAGVIGRRKFIYDLWGDAVNTASRMESHGTGGSIQITEATYELIKDDFICEAQGAIHIKGKGEMKVWYVLDKKA